MAPKYGCQVLYSLSVLMLSFEMGLVEQKDVSAWIVWEAELTEECGPEIINQKHKKRKRKLFPGLYDFVWYGHVHLLTFANQLDSFILSTTIHLPSLCMDMFFPYLIFMKFSWQPFTTMLLISHEHLGAYILLILSMSFFYNQIHLCVHLQCQIQHMIN